MKKTALSAFAGRHQVILADAALLALMLLVYGKSSWFPFVTWDDPLAIVDNRLIREPLAQGWSGLLLTPGLGYPQPLTVLTQHLDWWVAGGAAWVFHVSNLVLHGASVLLLRRIALCWGASPGAALAAAALFVVHPIVAEPVCWATGRKDLLVAFGALLATWAVAPRRPDKQWLGTLALGGGLAIALLSKPSGWVLPLWLAWCFAVQRKWPGRAALLMLSAALIATSLLAPAAYRSHAHFGGFTERSLVEALRFASEHAALQVRNLLAPVQLSAFYLEGFPLPWTSPWGIAGVALLLVVTAVLVWGWRYDPRVVFGVGASAIAFAPASGLVALHRGPADSYFYLPFAALALAVSAGVDRALAARPVVTPWLAGLVVFVYGGLGFAQADTWRSSVALFRPAVELYPDSAFAHESLAKAYFVEGSPRDGIEHFQRSIELGPYPPARPEPLLALAFGCYQLQELACSSRWYAEAVRHYPEDFGRALRLLSSAAALQREAPAVSSPLLAKYAEELARAEAVASSRLRALSELSEPERHAALQASFSRDLKEDGVPALALRRLAQRGELRPAASALLGMYPSPR